MRRGSAPRRQRGIALLTAILLVALGTILAATMAYQTALTARRGTATYAFDQSLLIAQAGEGLAAYALLESRKGSPQIDDPSEPWGMPYGPVEVVPGVTLLAQLEDMQGRFNLNRLVDDSGKIDLNALQQFETLLEILGLETRWASLAADWIDKDQIADGPEGAEDSTYLSQQPPYRTANRPITSASELLALPGFGRDRYLKLAPYVTALPRAARINLCSASGAVLDAIGPQGQRQFSALDPKTLASQRSMGCFPKLSDFNAGFADPKAMQAAAATIGTTSDYFRLVSIIQIGTTEFDLYSLLHREGDGRVRTIQRSFTAD